MTPEQAHYVMDLTRRLQEAHERQRPLTPSVLLHARGAVRSADAGHMQLTEAEEERMDKLYGLLQWGQMALPVLRIDPRVFAEQRRARRAGEASKVPAALWRD